MLQELKHNIASGVGVRFRIKLHAADESDMVHIIVAADEIGVCSVYGEDTVPVFTPWTSILKITAQPS